MTYYIARSLPTTFTEAVRQVREALASEGFGVISEIDVSKTFRDKLGVDVPPYLILGACNPTLAYEALKLEDKVGTMLPCNVVVQFKAGQVEVAAIDPVASMQAIPNPALLQKAGAVRAKLAAALERL